MDLRRIAGCAVLVLGTAAAAGAAEEPALADAVEHRSARSARCSMAAPTSTSRRSTA